MKIIWLKLPILTFMNESGNPFSVLQAKIFNVDILLHSKNFYHAFVSNLEMTKYRNPEKYLFGYRFTVRFKGGIPVSADGSSPVFPLYFDANPEIPFEKRPNPVIPLSRMPPYSLDTFHYYFILPVYMIPLSRMSQFAVCVDLIVRLCMPILDAGDG